MKTTALITPSWLPDIDRCRQLSHSVQEHASGFSKHYVLVDQRDELAFRQSLSAECEIIVKQDLLPAWLHQFKLNQKWWWSLRALPIRGWILQQITKLAITQHLAEEAYCFVDSDTQLVRPLMAQDLWFEDKLRFYRDDRKPHFYQSTRYKNWYGFAAKQLGLGDEQLLDGAYIAQLTTMRKDCVAEMLSALEEKNGRSWIEVLCRCLDFSEFVLYGVFVDECSSIDGHVGMSKSLCHSSWFYDLASQSDINEFVSGLGPDQVAVHLQSNLEFDAQALEAAVQMRR